jgi:PAS domain S-box-containing protein
LSDADRSAIHSDRPAAATKTGMAEHMELSAFAFQRTRMPMVVADARQSDMPIVLANDAFLELTGYSAEEILGRNCRFLQGEGTSRTAVAQLRAAIVNEREVNVEILNYKKDGTPFWNQLHLSAIRDDGGEVAYYFASQIDTTQYRKIQTLEDAEHRLLLEVDHRTKNVLAIVDSVVRLSRADNAASYAASVQHRVQALSRTHMLLAEKGWQQVSLADIVRTHVAIFDTGAVDLEGPDVMIPVQSVQPLGLAIHELAANAAVHGSLSTGEGSLSVAWSATRDGLRLRWDERGGPAPRREPAEGFGNVLLGAVVERQLGGTITRDWLDDGLSLTIELPTLDKGDGSLQARS